MQKKKKIKNYYSFLILSNINDIFHYVICTVLNIFTYEYIVPTKGFSPFFHILPNGAIL